MDPPTSPFYQWLDHARIRALIRNVLDLRPGERLVLLKGLVPGLVETLGADEAESFLSELATKVRRYEEARTHPGDGRLYRETPGEQLGGPTPEGHRHVADRRNPDRPGGRAGMGSGGLGARCRSRIGRAIPGAGGGHPRDVRVAGDATRRSGFGCMGGRRTVARLDAQQRVRDER
jgi:hypothetical protein